ncbi:MAG: glyoxylate/hydroxypyruvate reductase A [Rhodobacteraceae bacterium]|jgi:glyoxylate/hydroxypyruvate reductase A|nr:glyoxylate/hydroxypyruvate reductase A [Paracoccaceae bacterium]
MTDTPTILFAAKAESWDTWAAPLATALAEVGIAASVVTDADPAAVDYILHAPSGGLQDFTPYTRLKAVFSLWAGVEDVVGNPTLTVPLARMVDPGLRQGMVEWVTGHVLRHHLGLDADIRRDAAAWRPRVPPLSRDRRVGVLGLGELGSACAAALAGLGFDVAGWSRRPKSLSGLATHAGDAGLDAVLARSEILVLLLPRTPGTEGILNARTLALLPRGAVVLNPGRGALVDDAALLAALDSGQVGHATLDTFRVEPLPVAHPFWTHPAVTVTPHIAAATRPASAARVVAANLSRALAGQPLLHLVDRTAGY